MNLTKEYKARTKHKQTKDKQFKLRKKPKTTLVLRFASSEDFVVQ